MRRIGVVSVGRSDYGIYVPLLRKIRESLDLELHLIVSGTHLSPEFGRTVQTIEADGFEIGDRVEMLLSSDTPEGISKSMGLGVIGYAQSFAKTRPDILVVLGDRFEMHAAALAALPFNMPVAHIHGGELTYGAMDDSLRHSITKLSHLHFTSTDTYARRVVQMGEEPWRVFNCGALSLDNLLTQRLLDAGELSRQFGINLDQPPLVVTFHPATRESETPERQFREVLAALGALDMPVVFTAPNADTQGRVLFAMITEFVHGHESAVFVENLGTQGYFSLLRLSPAMVGNSSSGIIEAPSFGLPVVNIGSRQDGRVRSRNIIDVPNERSEIIRGIRTALDPAFRAQLRDMILPYGTGEASRVIVEQLESVPIDERLLTKRFLDSPSGTPT